MRTAHDSSQFTIAAICIVHVACRPLASTGNSRYGAA
jgi:hypothetical protein